MQRSAIVGSSTRFDYLVLATCLWFLAGILIDGFAHNHYDLSHESFFTPFHAMLYAGFLAVAAVIVPRTLRGVRNGLTWRESIPGGYESTLLGIGIFAVGSVLDMLWHLAFGIEQSLSALFSPAHQILAFGASLMFVGPLRASLRRGDRPTPIVAICSLTLLLIVVEFFTQWTLDPGAASVWSPERFAAGAAALDPRSSAAIELQRFRFYAISHGMLSILLRSIIVTGTLLYAMRRLTLRFGAMTMIFGSSTLLLTVMRSPQVVPIVIQMSSAIVAGIVADVLVARYERAGGPTRLLRIAAMVVPASWWAVFLLLTAFLEGGWWWEFHAATGSVVFSAFAGLLLSYVVEPVERPRPNAASLDRLSSSDMPPVLKATIR